jgi:uncharacterized protein
MKELDSSERNMAVMGHLGALLITFVAPLILMLTKGKESAFVNAHAVDSLNFQISLWIYFLVAYILTFVLIGFLLYIPLFAIAVIFPIMAAIKASNGESFNYPLTIRFFR